MLDRIIDSLMMPSSYPHPVGAVEVIQTHISYVLLAGDFAYKLKKPLTLPFLDYSTLERRKAMCDEELRINRRLCDGVYLDVAPITHDRSGFSVEGAGEVAEYAVRMRRVPSDRMLDSMIESSIPDLEQFMHIIAGKMARFHRGAATNDTIAAFGRPEAVRRNWDENFELLDSAGEGDSSAVEVALLREYGSRFFHDNEALLLERVTDGRIRDCHGDLRADSVYLDTEGNCCILDAIEFNERLRFGDVAGDIGFLAMDLDRRGRPDLHDELMATYLAAAPDECLPLVLNFYKTSRAIVRAKVEALRSMESEVPARARQVSREAVPRYLALARHYATQYPTPRLIYMVGLSGSGKSYVANALACRLQAAVVSSDVLRRTIVPDGAVDYSPARRAAIYERSRERARQHLEAGRAVILDATHITRAERDAARALAAAVGVPSIAIEVVADETVVRTRLAHRGREALSPSDATWGVYVEQRREFEPIADDEGRAMHVDGLLKASKAVMEILNAL